jgi:hypothetical protein
VNSKLPRKYNALLTAVLVLGLLAWQYFNPESDANRTAVTSESSESVVESAYAARRSGVWMETSGRISRILPDDNDGSRHQRFILDVGSGHTVMVAHNIDLADRVPVAVGDTLALRGRYEWNERGGVIHWTHHDPKGLEKGGWIEVSGQRYR